MNHARIAQFPSLARRSRNSPRWRVGLLLGLVAVLRTVIYNSLSRDEVADDPDEQDDWDKANQSHNQHLSPSHRTPTRSVSEDRSLLTPRSRFGSGVGK